MMRWLTYACSRYVSRETFSKIGTDMVRMYVFRVKGV